MTDGAIVADVLNVYRERVPGFGWDSIAVAVNQEYARAVVALRDGDEVALLPPVRAGAADNNKSKSEMPFPDSTSLSVRRTRFWG